MYVAFMVKTFEFRFQFGLFCFFTFQTLCPAVLKAQRALFGIPSFTPRKDFGLRPRGPLHLLLR